jgi:itaconate CoA-transferase
VGDARFSTNTRRSEARVELHALVVAAFSTLTLGEVIERLEKAGIANARMNDMSDLWAHPQLEARARWTDIETSAGTIPALLPPGMTKARMDAVPALGEHTGAILEELGYGAEEISRLREERVV